MRAELGYIVESDLDLILMMDARTGGPLTAYLFERLDLASPDGVTATRSTLRCDGMRETDVEIIWPKGAVLVEDKVDAAFTQGQPESYYSEVQDRTAPDFTVKAVLVCPTRRLQHYRDQSQLPDGTPCFDAYVTCGQLAEVAKAQGNGDRLASAAAMVMRAAEEPRPAEGAPEDPERSAWGDEYRRILAGYVPHTDSLQVGAKSLRKATASNANFLSAGIDPPSVWSFGHDLLMGEVRMEIMIDTPPVGLGDDVVVDKKKVMTYLIRRVPPMTFELSPEQQRTAIAAAAQAAIELRHWVNDHLQN